MSATGILDSAREQLLSELARDLQALDDVGLRRHLRAIDAVDGVRVTVEGRQLICWCSNDSLGLSRHPALSEAAAQAAAEWGVGARASRLLAGTTRCHLELEEELAAWFGAQAALVFSSGYLANLGTLRALLGPGDFIVADRCSHASLIDAARSTGATFRLFQHNDVEHAARLLARGRGRRRVIVTEGVFSMEGDRAPVGQLSAVARAHGALVYVDDAHGAFAVGETGRGAPEAAGMSADDFLYMGTLGKALGAQGGFVVGPAVLIEFLRNRARTFVYATALAVPIAAAALAALRLLQHDRSPQQRLMGRSRQLFDALRGMPGFQLREPSHIVPIILGEARQASALSRGLWELGMWCPAIRPPTVPDGQARLRLSVTAAHAEADVMALADALRHLGQPHT